MILTHQPSQTNNPGFQNGEVKPPRKGPAAADCSVSFCTLLDLVNPLL